MSYNLATKNMIRGFIKVYKSVGCSVKWIKHSVNEGIKHTYHIPVDQQMVLRWWLALYVSMGSMGRWKTDVNFSYRLQTYKTVQMTEEYVCNIQQITNNSCQPGCNFLAQTVRIYYVAIKQDLMLDTANTMLGPLQPTLREKPPLICQG